jgi:hypothetical protein
MARLQVPLPRAVWFAQAVLSAQRPQPPPPAAAAPPPGMPPLPRHAAAAAAAAAAASAAAPGPPQIWTGALLALLSQLAMALGWEPERATAAGAAAVATPPQPAPAPPATEQSAYRGAAAGAGAPENPAAAAATGAPAASAEHAAARLVEAAGGDAARLRVLWEYAVRLGAYSLGAGLSDPATALDWVLPRLGAAPLEGPAAPGAAGGAGASVGAGAPRGGAAPAVQEAALQLALAAVEGVATSGPAVARLIDACLPLAERAAAESSGGGAPPGEAVAQPAAALAGDVIAALVLQAPGALPGLECLPRLARLLEAREAAAAAGGGGGGGGGLLRLAREGVEAAAAEAAALARGVSPRYGASTGARLQLRPAFWGPARSRVLPLGLLAVWLCTP